MPDRFESSIFSAELTDLMKDAFNEAWSQADLIDRDRELMRHMLATAIIDEVKAGIRDRDEIVAAVVSVVAAARGAK
jgi:hypothetical protein